MRCVSLAGRTSSTLRTHSTRFCTANPPAPAKCSSAPSAAALRRPPSSTPPRQPPPPPPGRLRRQSQPRWRPHPHQQRRPRRFLLPVPCLPGAAPQWQVACRMQTSLQRLSVASQRPARLEVRNLQRSLRHPQPLAVRSHRTGLQRSRAARQTRPGRPETRRSCQRRRILLQSCIACRSAARLPAAMALSVQVCTCTHLTLLPWFGTQSCRSSTLMSTWQV